MSLQAPLFEMEEPSVMMEINTTPLIDVMLVLLVMLIITIPVQLHAVKLELPVGKPPSAQTPPHVRIDIDATNQVYWQGTAVDLTQLTQHFQEAAHQQPAPDIQLRPDRHASYATFAAVLAASRRSGLSHLAVTGSEQFMQ